MDEKNAKNDVISKRENSVSYKIGKYIHQNMSQYALLILALFALVFVVYIMTDDGRPTLLFAFGAILFAFVMSLFCKYYENTTSIEIEDAYKEINQRAREKEQAEAQEKAKMDSLKSQAVFYEKCVLEKIDDLKAESRQIKASNLARKMGIEFSDIKELYNSSKSAKDKLEVMHVDKQERAFIKCQKMVIAKTGIKKTVEMLSQEMKPHELKYAKYDALSRGVQAPQIPEKDWAILGGIASGLAGPAAGISTALSFMEENNQIREQNQQSIHLAAQLKVLYDDNKWAAKRAISEIEGKIESAEKKLVGRESVEELFSMLDFYDAQVEVSKTGRFKLHTFVQMNKELIIYDDLNASIDGYVVAEILDNGKKISEAIMVFPKNGITTAGAEVFAISEDTIGQINKKYELEFTPYSLWSVEK